MDGPLSRRALHHAVSMSAEVELQLESRERTSPLIALLTKAQRAAAAAIVAMADIDPESPAVIRAVQNEIKCFELIVQWLKEIVAEGFDAGDLLDIAEREELAEQILASEEGANDSGLPQTED